MSINLSYLEDITGGDIEVMQEMLDLFIKDVPIHVTSIEHNFKSGKIEEVAIEAHKVKPAMQYIGETELFEVIQQIEVIAKKKEGLDQLPELVRVLSNRLETLIESLKQKREELG